MANGVTIGATAGIANFPAVLRTAVQMEAMPVRAITGSNP